MSNFGFSDLVSKSSGELARQANISASGDTILIKSTYDDPEKSLPTAEGQTLSEGLALQALIDAVLNEETSPVGERAGLRNAAFAFLRSKLKENGPDKGGLPTWNSLYVKSFDPNGPNEKPLVPDGEPTAEDSKKILKRFLQERSFLVFEYPIQKGLKEFSILPFFENISISESQKANFAVYDLIGRAGNLYGYMGAKSRQFNLNFRMTVPHIRHLMKTEGLVIQDFSQSFSDPENKSEIRNRFINPQVTRGTTGRGFSRVNATKLATNYFFKLKQEDPNYLVTTRNNELPDPNPYAETITDVLWWVNLVRTSVINNSTNSIYGPPIIRINHGILYNNVPCICTNFSIKEAQGTTYDVVTNFPYVFDITMALEEVRNNFGEYTPGDPVKGDNITGWDGLKKYGTMDSYNGPWGAK